MVGQSIRRSKAKEVKMDEKTKEALKELGELATEAACDSFKTARDTSTLATESLTEFPIEVGLRVLSVILNIGSAVILAKRDN